MNSYVHRLSGNEHRLLKYGPKKKFVLQRIEAENPRAETEIRRTHEEAQQRERDAIREALARVTKPIHQMLEAEFEQFQTDIIERVRELWPGYTRLLIDNPDKHIKGILQSFRSDPDANPRHCVANMCVGDVQAGKTPIIALTAIVLHLICCDRRIVDQPHLVVIEDRNSSRDAMIPKLTRLLSDYQDGRIPVGLPKEAVSIQRGGGVLVTARTAHQIGQATLDEVDDGRKSLFLSSPAPRTSCLMRQTTFWALVRASKSLRRRLTVFLGTGRHVARPSCRRRFSFPTATLFDVLFKTRMTSL